MDTKKIIELLKGKKTYITVAIGAILAGVKMYGIDIPDDVWTILGLFGLAFLRDAINNLPKVK